MFSGGVANMSNIKIAGDLVKLAEELIKKSYFIKEGDSLLSAFERTNLYEDMLGARADDIYRSFKGIVSEYKPIAENLKNKIEKFAYFVTKEDGAAIDELIYDGFDIYDNAISFKKNMPYVYDCQIKLFKRILGKIK